MSCGALARSVLGGNVEREGVERNIRRQARVSQPLHRRRKISCPFRVAQVGRQ